MWEGKKKSLSLQAVKIKIDPHSVCERSVFYSFILPINFACPYIFDLCQQVFFKVQLKFLS